MKLTDRVLWLGIGVAVGAGIALLYAPRTGKETRRLIRKRADSVQRTVVDTTGQIRDRVVETSEQIRDAGREVYRRGATLAAGAQGLFEAGRKAVRG